MRVFRDRRDAGRILAHRFDRYLGHADVVVIALPHGGVPVAYEIAKWIRAPLDVLVVRTLYVPGHPDVAMGAIASGGIEIVDHRVMNLLGVSRDELDAVEAREQDELRRCERNLGLARPPIEMAGKIAILVDDGVTTGDAMAIGIDAIRARAPARIIATAPVAALKTYEALRERTDEIVCLVTPDPMYVISVWYEDFTQITNAEVRELLAAAATHELTMSLAREAPSLH